ncbi:MAG TPA: C4-type zinc ribbon domain-containing protein [Longimicrobium sp.]|jgi:predicted  nucleic acid-binding Zn-ribbon protein|nr:C4-type zinc ribbon domain-containing protein [Longimicrobium sp.]
MHPHLETLLEIQDLKTQRRELAETGGDREVQESVFGLSVDDALAQIDEKVTEMEASLPPQVRGRLQRMQAKHPRVVVPVIRGTCYGCFVQVPTALASDADRNEEVRTCQSCGRFLYLID